MIWVDAAMAARSILCSAGAMASDSAAAPALPNPAKQRICLRDSPSCSS